MKPKIIALLALSVLVLNIVVMLPKNVAAESEFVMREVMDEGLIERGAEYAIYDLGDGQRRLETGLPPWVYDELQGKYVPHILKVDNEILVQSGMIGWKVDKYYGLLYDKDMKELRAKETWFVSFEGNPVNMTFSKREVTENTTGVFIFNHYDISINSQHGDMQIIYAIYDGAASQRIVKINGFTSEIVEAIEVKREWSRVNADTISIDKFVDSINAAEKTRVVNGDETLASIKLANKPQVNEFLAASKDWLQRIEYQNEKIIFVYSGWSGDRVVLIDDTYTNAAATDDNTITTNQATGTSCPSTTFTKSNGTLLNADAFASDSSTGVCRRAYVEWNISSILDGSTITQVQFQFEVQLAQGGRNCNITALTSNRPSTTDASTLWSAIGSATEYLSNDSTCASVGSGKSVTLGSQANTDLQNQLTSDWYAVGFQLASETREAGVNHANRLYDQSHASVTTKPTLLVTYQLPNVTVQITLNMRTGSDTLETAGVVATVSGAGCTGTLTHDANPATVSYTCSAASTITVTMPSDAANSRYRFSTGSTTAQFQSCNSGTCSTQTFNDVTRQFRIGLTLSGLDASRTIDVTRTIIGTATTQSVSGATATDIWPDQASTFTIPSSKVITADQERFQSYNSSSALSFTVNNANSGARMIVYQHEFNQLFRINEVHQGTIFSPMPSVTFTSTITTANGTTISGTFGTQNTDDYVELSSRYWVKNGTQTAGTITWRDIVVRPSGDTCSITSYGNCDFDVYSFHYGISDRKDHFRGGVDGATAALDNVSFDSSTNVLTFNGTASGTKTIKVEFLANNFETVNKVEVDNTAIDGSRFSISTIDSSTRLLTITGTSFSEKTIEVFFAAGSSSSPSTGSAGGGGGGGGGGSVVIPTPSGTTTGQAFHLKVTVPVYTVAPGGSATQNIMIEWEGATKVVISQIQFAQNGEWFTFGKSLPYAVTLEGGKTTLQSELQMRVMVPSDVQGVERTIPMRVTAIAGSGTETVEVPVRIVLSSTSDLGLYAGLAAVVAIGGAVGFKQIKRR